MTPEIERALDVFELRAAREVWKTLTQEERDILCRMARGGGELPQESSGVGEKKEYLELPHSDRLRNALHLIELGLTFGDIGFFDRYGTFIKSGSESWPAYKFTSFGAVVGRVGNALRIVELSAA